MDKILMEKCKKQLLEEKEKINKTLLSIKKNDTTGNLKDLSELSYYDNHPYDIASELDSIEVGDALKDNEEMIMDKVDLALLKIEKNKFGSCEMCHKEIEKERIEFIPYARFCVNCQKEVDRDKNVDSNEIDNSTKSLNEIYRDGFNNKDSEMNAKDMYDMVESHNRDSFEQDKKENYADPVESVSQSSFANTVKNS